MTLEAEISQCRKCAELLAWKPVELKPDAEQVEPRPIVPRFQSQTVLLIGQAPGLMEYREREPFKGDAGKGIRKILKDAGIPYDRFDEIVYSAAVVRCFPGSKQGGRGGREDCLPSAKMVRNCLPYLRRQFELYRPKVVITLGSFALRNYLRLRGRNQRGVKLEMFVGSKEEWDGATVIFLPHTSGSSRWLNKPGNRALLSGAKEILRGALSEDKPPPKLQRRWARARARRCISPGRVRTPRGR